MPHCFPSLPPSYPFSLPSSYHVATKCFMYSFRSFIFAGDGDSCVWQAWVLVPHICSISLPFFWCVFCSTRNICNSVVVSLFFPPLLPSSAMAGYVVITGDTFSRIVENLGKWFVPAISQCGPQTCRCTMPLPLLSSCFFFPPSSLPFPLLAFLLLPCSLFSPSYPSDPQERMAH